MATNTLQAQTCTFTSKILASNNPFGSCPIGTDTIIIKDTFDINVNYEPLLGGLPFDGILRIEGGVLFWSSNVFLKLGTNARILLYNNGRIYPGDVSDVGCSAVKTIYFDNLKLASCSGVNALHAFSDVNRAGCFDGTGICCDATITAKEDSGFPNDLTLCEPGDSVELSVIGSGSIDYNYLWTPNIGSENGPYKVAQYTNKTYSVDITAIFDPFGASPPYLLTCGSSTTVKINPKINLIANSTAVPCASSATGSINLTVSGGTAPYKFNWSNAKTTEDINNLVAGTYTVTVTDAKGCSEVKTATVITFDNTPPTLSCPTNGSGVAVANLCTTTIPNIDAVFSDNCPAAQLSYQITGATVTTGNGQLSNNLPFYVGTSTVTYRVNDGSNTVSCNFSVTVEDNQFPTASNPTIITGIQCFDELPAPNPAVVTDEADNCGAPNVTFLSQSTIGGLSCPGNPLIVSRKYRVVDNSGNGITVTQFLHVADSTPPAFTQVPANVTVSCQAIPTVGIAAASDNCDNTVTPTYLGETRTNGACPDSYTLTRTWRTIDNCGNSATASQTITVQDLSSPVFTTVPANVTVNCNAIPNVGTPVASDNCDVSVAISYLGETRINGSCQYYYALRRSWSATDNCGNVSTTEQIITVQDVTAPAFTSVPQNITVSCESIPVAGTPVAADNCSASVDITYLGETRINGACPDSYTLRRTWRAADNCGNSSSATQQITVQDIIAPVFSSVPANVTVSCDAIPTVGVPVATDNCDSDASITYNGETRTNGACSFSYTLKRQWTAVDNCGNAKTATQTITVQDVTKPVFTSIPPNTTVSCEAIPTVGVPVATDNCDPSVAISYNGEVRENGACLNTYILRRRWTANDQCGNSATTEQVITVQDLTPPVYTFIPDPLTVSCDAIPSVGTPTATDNCDASVSISYSGQTRVNGTCANRYSLRREWVATDNCGNTAKSTQIITVQDVTAPVFTSVPAAVTASCESLPTVGTPTATDNCSANVTITYLGESAPSNNGACPGNYGIIRTWSASDECGNTATATQVITVQDIKVPVVTSVPANVTVSCSEIPPVGTPTATDNCDATPNVTYNGATRINGTCPNSYTLQRKWTITDDCGNATSAMQTLTVQDVTAPVFVTVPAAITVSCETIPAVGTPTASDNCAASVNITYNGATRIDGACPDSYTLQRSWTALDSCGNAATTIQIITVQDVTAPVFTSVPQAITVSCDAIPAVGAPTATDNCDAAVAISYAGQTRTDGSCPGNYLLNREWVATDNCGNTSKATQVITVRDITSPVFTSVPAATTASCELLPAVGTPTATDNCSANISITYLGESAQGSGGACPGNYGIIRTWSAQDECGNTATASQVITVQDISAPVVSAVPANVTVSCANIPAVGTPVAVDNCDATPTITYNGATRTNGSCPNSYTLQRKWTITDDCGNSSTAVQTLTVQDISAPVFTSVPAPVTVSCESIPAVGTPVAADDCAAQVAITYNGATRIDGACSDSYTLQRSWTAVDSCGNAATAMQIITVQDITPPSFTFVPAPVTVSCEAVPAVGTPIATDNCDAGVSITYQGEVRTNGACPNSYTLRRSWIAVDNCNNATTASQLITVQDITAPVFTSVPAPVTVNCDAIPAVGTPTATDNCSSVGISFLHEIITNGNCAGNYTITRTWVAADECQNSTSASQLITVRDVTAPVVTTVPANVTVSCSAIPAVGTPTATDNCDANPTITYNGATRTNGVCPNSYTLLRKWTVQDACGNTSTAVQTLTVEDITAPVFTLVPANVTVSCESIPAVETPLAADDCAASVNITYNGAVRTDGPCTDTYTLRRSWTAKDSCGNTSTAAQLITVRDITAPNFTMIPANVTVSCDAIPVVTTPTAGYNCDAFVTINYSGQVRVDGNCTHTYLLRREWVATDNCGNSATATQVVTVQDITAPVFTLVPPAITVNCDAIPAIGTPTATDNCDPGVTITYDGEIRSNGACPNNFTLKRIWTAADDCGNTTSASQIITVQDITKPLFTFVPQDTMVNCDAIPAPGTPTATDNCSSQPTIVFVGETVMNSTSTDSYTLQRKWTATDECNNVTTGIQLLTVQDTVAPTIQCPANVVLLANAATCSAIATFSMPVTDDNCSTSLNISATANSGQAFPVGVTPVSFTVKDASGNTSTCQFTVTAKDTTAPVLVNCPANQVFTTAANSCSTIVSWTDPTVTDPCDNYLITPSVSIPSGSVLTTGAYIITYDAVDTTGNSTQCSFSVTVRETVPPVLSNCPQDLVLHTDTCNAVANWLEPDATDNCALGTVTVNIPSGSLFQETNTVVQYTATDLWGNTATCSFNVKVIDDVNPQFGVCPDNVVVNAGICSIPVNWLQPTATDNCVADPVVRSIPSPGDVFPTGFTTVQIFVTDQSGNQDTCSFVVEVIGPPIGLTNLPVNQSFVGCDAIATWTPPVATGICGPITLTSNYSPGDTFGIGTTEVVYTLKDTLDHTVTSSFTITVTESIAPQFSCPQSTVKVNVSGDVMFDPSNFVSGTDTVSTCDGVELKFQLPAATDNCSVPEVRQESGFISGSTFDVGMHMVSFKAKDDAGNTTMCSVQIQVLPLMPLNPVVSDVIACKGDEITLSATVVPGATYSWTGPKPPYPDDNSLLITDLDASLTGFYAVFANVNGCLTPLDSARVRIGQLPVVEDDLDYEVATNEVLADFNVLLNDTYELDDYTIEVTSPLQGLINHGKGIFSFEAGNKNTVSSFIYKLCSKTCPDLCEEGIVSILVRERVCTFIPNIFTPNGDGINDFLVIPCLDIETYPENHLIVYNQWGDKVYEAAPYSNEPDKAWRGTLYGENGRDLPDAAYYYIFKATPGDAGLKGFVEIFR